MKFSLQQELALQAALLPADQAVKSWNSLVALTPVEELDASITRILPAVYQNLRGTSPISQDAKLKGSHLFTWAKNTEFFTNLKPLLQSLADSKIEYRILKGGAINFLFQSLGIRSMGDIDILVSRHNLDRFQELLVEAGFIRKFADSCPHVEPGDSDQELNFVNTGNIEIDLHVAEDRRPALLFKLLMENPPRICEFMDLQIQIPSVELLILHSIYHGAIGVQASDEIQSMLDVHRLIQLADKSSLRRLSEKLHFNDLLERYLGAIEEITGTHIDLDISQSGRLWHRVRYEFSGAAIFLERLKDFSTIRRSRAVGLREISAVIRSFPGHRFSYAFWLFTGKLRPVERFFYLRHGGFLKLGIDQAQSNPFASRCQDWRFAFETSAGTKRISVKLNSQSLSTQNFLVFINGLVGGVTERSVEGSHTLEILNPAEHVEISLRLPANGCEACAAKLGDLVFQIA